LAEAVGAALSQKYQFVKGEIPFTSFIKGELPFTGFEALKLLSKACF
jgi:hypothetical protein